MTLPDLLEPGLRAVICGTSVATASAARGHYYACPGNDFWRLLHVAGLTPHQLTPDEDRTLLRLGIGLTDLVKDVISSTDRGLSGHYDVPTFVTKIAEYRPHWVGLHGKTVARVVSRHRGLPVPALGEQTWTLGRSRVFVLPQSSGANRRASYEGRLNRDEWWAEFGALAR